MEQHLFVLLLSIGVLPIVLSVDRTFYLIQEEKTWSDAQAYCRDTYTDLVTITSEEDKTKIQEQVQAHQFFSSAWCGLYRNVDTWYWSFNNEPLGSFTPWKTGEPDHATGYEQCGCIHGEQWSEKPCEWSQPFVCFDDTKTGADRYIAVSTSVKWYDAQIYCREQYTDLVSIKDGTENTAVGALAPWQLYWIGLRRDPWKWSDQTTDTSKVQWLWGELNDNPASKGCGYLANSAADIALCSNLMPFYCYSQVFPDRQQIIRVKVSSREDVNDPTVTAAIFEKIKQKLKDHGLFGNNTVKWRRQPNGLVFQKEENNTRTMRNTKESCDLKETSYCGYCSA